MGNFYCNFTTRGPSVDDIARVLTDHGRTAYVSPTVEGKTVVFDEAADELDPVEIDRVGELLSRELGCPALAAAVADDDELWLALYEAGERRVEYSSRGANHGALALSRAFGRPWMCPLVWVLLQWPYLVFESWRHGLLAKALGVPGWCVATGFRYIEQDELPEGLDASDLRRTDRGA
jgi:hypothetical protein